MADKQKRFIGHGIPKTVNHRRLGCLVKIDDHIPAEYNVQAPLA